MEQVAPLSQSIIINRFINWAWPDHKTDMFLMIPASFYCLNITKNIGRRISTKTNFYPKKCPETCYEWTRSYDTPSYHIPHPSLYQSLSKVRKGYTCNSTFRLHPVARQDEATDCISCTSEGHSSHSAATHEFCVSATSVSVCMTCPSHFTTPPTTTTTVHQTWCWVSCSILKPRSDRMLWKAGNCVMTLGQWEEDVD